MDSGSIAENSSVRDTDPLQSMVDHSNLDENTPTSQRLAKWVLSFIPRSRDHPLVRFAGSLGIVFVGYVLCLSFFQHFLIYMYPRYSSSWMYYDLQLQPFLFCTEKGVLSELQANLDAKEGIVEPLSGPLNGKLKVSGTSVVQRPYFNPKANPTSFVQWNKYESMRMKVIPIQFSKTEMGLTRELSDDILKVDIAADTGVQFFIPSVSDSMHMQSGRGPVSLLEGEELVLCFGGNGMTAQDWQPVVKSYHNQGPQRSKTAFMLIDYPAYGQNSGNPDPGNILSQVQHAVRALFEHYSQLYQMPVSGKTTVSLLGHSLGTSVALSTAAWILSHGQYQPRTQRVWFQDSIVFQPGHTYGNNVPLEGSALRVRVNDIDMQLELGNIVLLSPFTTLEAVARRIVGNVPFQHYLLRHNFDSVATLQYLQGIAITVIHGTHDEIVPYSMGVELVNQAEKHGVHAELVTQHKYNHNNVFDEKGSLAILQALKSQVNNNK